jgi:hypothetical protein
MKKYLLPVSFYLPFYALIFISHKDYPTNMAGPGLDILVFGVYVVVSIFFIVKNTFLYFNVDKSFKNSCLIHMLGLIWIFVSLAFL